MEQGAISVVDGGQPQVEWTGDSCEVRGYINLVIVVLGAVRKMTITGFLVGLPHHPSPTPFPVDFVEGFFTFTRSDRL